LRELGYDVIYVAEHAPSETDDNILAWARREQRILLTQDKDFSELIFRDDNPTYGVVLIRIAGSHRLERASRIQTLVEHHENDLLNAMTTVTLDRIRIRHLDSDS
jgi:predicted nuclease of predicted toxin-antitoxin system